MKIASFSRAEPRLSAALLVLVAVLTGCSTDGSATFSESIERSAGVYIDVTKWPVAEADYRERQGDYVRNFLADKTVMTYSGIHGTQIEYTASNGRVFLWYPGNSGVVTGRVRSKRGGTIPTICYTYQTNSYNPATGKRGGTEQCRTGMAISILRESANGDPFHLASGRIPFVLPRGKTTISKLYKRYKKQAR